MTKRKSTSLIDVLTMEIPLAVLPEPMDWKSRALLCEILADQNCQYVTTSLEYDPETKKTVTDQKFKDSGGMAIDIRNSLEKANISKSAAPISDIKNFVPSALLTRSVDSLMSPITEYNKYGYDHQYDVFQTPDFTLIVKDDFQETFEQLDVSKLKPEHIGFNFLLILHDAFDLPNNLPNAYQIASNGLQLLQSLVQPVVPSLPSPDHGSYDVPIQFVLPSTFPRP